MPRHIVIVRFSSRISSTRNCCGSHGWGYVRTFVVLCRWCQMSYGIIERRQTRQNSLWHAQAHAHAHTQLHLWRLWPRPNQCSYVARVADFYSRSVSAARQYQRRPTHTRAVVHMLAWKITFIFVNRTKRAHISLYHFAVWNIFEAAHSGYSVCVCVCVLCGVNRYERAPN